MQEKKISIFSKTLGMFNLQEQKKTIQNNCPSAIVDEGKLNHFFKTILQLL